MVRRDPTTIQLHFSCETSSHLLFRVNNYLTSHLVWIAESFNVACCHTRLHKMNKTSRIWIYLKWIDADSGKDDCDCEMGSTCPSVNNFLMQPFFASWISSGSISHFSFTSDAGSIDVLLLHKICVTTTSFTRVHKMNKSLSISEYVQNGLMQGQAGKDQCNGEKGLNTH